MEYYKRPRKVNYFIFVWLLTILLWIGQANSSGNEITQLQETIRTQDSTIEILHRVVNMPCQAVYTHNDTILLQEMEKTLGRMVTFKTHK